MAMGSENRARRAQRSRDKTREVRRMRRTSIDVDDLDLDALDHRSLRPHASDPLGR
ncbi:hypothetical protein [Actinomycetospora termitidis]|uniref:Uncharacterized protein n=1 Tax=Actinomycetospora termitidis TaxID=3053470 RepID=A0ABT7MH34_9PSEU|nr:hypothetical protein [Actinomycetospora sp. Odt1-22]MDL5159999.1 hypothetical protein [Actinomycetospora sp. Odt1-22]